MMAKKRRLTRKAKRLLFISDLHCGHVCGLTHPDYNPDYGPDNDSTGQHKTRLKRLRKTRKMLYDWWIKRVKQFQPFDVIVINGDAIDGKGTKSGGTEQLSTNCDEQVEMAEVIINEIRTDNSTVLLTYGSRYHVSKDGEDWEDVLARKLGAKIQGEIHLDVNGLIIAAKHKIGGSKSPVSRFTPLSNAQLRQTLWALRGQQPKVDIIVRSHVHRCLIIQEPGTSSLVVTTPALQGLGSKFGIRQVDGLPVEYGFLVMDVVSREEWSLHPMIATLEMQKCSVTKL